MHALSTQEAEASDISEFEASLVYRTSVNVSKHSKTEQKFLTDCWEPKGFSN